MINDRVNDFSAFYYRLSRFFGNREVFLQHPRRSKRLNSQYAEVVRPVHLAKYTDGETTKKGALA